MGGRVLGCDVSICVIGGGVATRIRFCDTVVTNVPLMSLCSLCWREYSVPYLQHQNSNFCTQFQKLWHDVPLDLPWATEACCVPRILRRTGSFLLLVLKWRENPDVCALCAVGAPPDAVNLWIGDNRAVSSVHKDPYENLYCVVTGEKHFTLLPPTDYHCLYETSYPQGQFQQEGGPGGRWEVQGAVDPQGQLVTDHVPWVPVDVDHPDLERFPRFQHANPIHVVSWLLCDSFD